MGFTCNREELLSILSIQRQSMKTSTWTGKKRRKKGKPFYGNVYLTGDYSETVLFHCDRNKTKICHSISVDKHWGALPMGIPINDLFHIVRDSNAETVGFCIDKNHAVITAGNATFKIIPDYDVPSKPVLPRDGWSEMDGKDLCSALQDVLFCVRRGDGECYSYMRGVCVKIVDDSIEFAATDTNRLAVSRKNLGGERIVSSCVAPMKGMKALQRIAEGQEKVHIRLTDTELIAKTESCKIVMEAIDSEFVNYSKIISQKGKSHATFVKQELINALSLVGVACNKETHSLRIIAKSIGFVFETTKTAIFDGNAEGCIDLVGEGGEFLINYKFLLEAVLRIDCYTIRIHFGESEEPVYIEYGDFKYVLMPLNPEFDC